MTGPISHPRPRCGPLLHLVNVLTILTIGSSGP